MTSRSLGTLAAIAPVGVFAASVDAQSCIVGDLTGDSIVDGADLGALLLDWNRSGVPADLDGDGIVNGFDLGELLLHWGEPGFATGAFPNAWISGGPACATEHDFQIHQYNEDTFILRESLCTNFEAPFIYLLFGEDKVLMQDTGATSTIPTAATVMNIINQWLADHAKTSIQLIVTHSHGHGDHIAGDSQFIGQPDTTVVGVSATSVQNFFGITDWPEQIVQYDLGGRVIDVIPIPGHQAAHIALYDAQTRILFTGDTLYPGRLYVSDFPTYVETIGRLVEFTDTHPVCWVLGTHIEMTNTPGEDFNFAVTHHPDEHPLQLTRDHLLELHEGVLAMQDSPFIEAHDDFIIYPLTFFKRPPQD